MSDQEMVQKEGVQVVGQLLESADMMLEEAGKAIHQQDSDKENLYGSQSIAIIKALKEGLDEEKGGDIAQTLNDLYSYMIERIVEGFQAQDGHYVEEVRKLLKELIEGWAGVKEASVSMVAA